MPGSSVDLALAGEAERRTRRRRAPPARRCGRRSRGRRRRRRARRGRRARRRRRRSVRWSGRASASRRLRARSCPATPGSSCRPTTRPRTSSRWSSRSVPRAPDAHVLVVDDGSPDGTGEIADALAERHPAVEVLHRPRKAGLGLAYVHGFAHALAGGASCVIEMDADFSHDPRDLPRLLAAARGGADLVLGSRYVRRRRRRGLGPAAARDLARRLPLRAHGARRAGPRPHGRLQVLPRRRRWRRSTSRPCARRATRSRSS